ncbi:MAG: glycogen synthase [Synergistaceae bacterium]|jgi:starch synthase|nr:glycogen synthase [Synergistaceae bacterium]
MKVLFASSEARPFFATGELGDMAGSLPPALQSAGADMTVILPLYGDIALEWRARMRYVTNFVVPVSWRSQYCGLFELTWRGITFYFLDNEYYFKRSAMYGFYDDDERFAFFSRAILETLFHVGLTPDVIHCNDWQTALAPAYLNLYYRHIEKYARIKTAFTIHDLQYQGKFGPEILEGTVGIGRGDFHVVEFDGIVNYTKGAIESSDVVNAVSPTYAGEILDPWYGQGLYGFLRERKGKLRGILNGIDTDEYNPATDAGIAAGYGVENFEQGKDSCRKELREIFGLDESSDPVIGMVTRFDLHKGLDLLIHMADEIVSSGMQMAIAGEGGDRYEQFFGELEARRSGRFSARVGPLSDLSHKVFAGSDMFLMPSRSEPCGLAQMAAMRYGSVPIVRMTGGLRDTIVDCGDGAGNGFTFVSYSADDMLEACRRARMMFMDRPAWNMLARRAMRCNHGWGKPAKEYLEMYRDAVKSW